MIYLWNIFIIKVFAAGFTTGIHIDNPSKFGSLQEALGALIEFFLEGAATWAFIGLVYAGIMYITSSKVGDEKKLTTGKNMIIWVITGMIIVLLSVALVTWVVQIVNNNIK